MAKYIDAEALKELFADSAALCNDIDEFPAADVRENKHGRWTIKAINTFELSYGTTAYEPVYECSVCGGVEESYLRLDEPIMPDDADFPNYCPNCGADMRRWLDDDGT